MPPGRIFHVVSNYLALYRDMIGVSSKPTTSLVSGLSTSEFLSVAIRLSFLIFFGSTLLF